MNILRKYNLRKGTTIVEAAIVLPLLLLLTFGAFKYGWLFFKHQQIINTARQVARVAIRPGDRTTDIMAEFNRQVARCNIAGADYSPKDGANVSTGSDVIVRVWVSTANVDILDIKMFPSVMTPDELAAEIKMTKEGF